MFGFDNVFYDKNSHYEFEQLNETTGLESVFKALKLQSVDFDSYNYFIFSSHDVNITPISVGIPLKNKILIYISETTGNIPSQDILKEYLCIFKVHLNKGKHIDKENLYPYPLGVTKYIPKLEIVPFLNRDINLFFVGNLNVNRFELYFEFLCSSCFLFHFFSYLTKTKKMIIKWLFNKVKLRSFNRVVKNSIVEFTDGFQKGYASDKYAEMLYNSKIVLSAKGFVDSECFRIYEAMRAGCVVISEKLPDVDFYNNSPIIQVDSWSGINKKLKKLLADENKLAKLSAETLKYYNENFSPEGIANYIENTINSCLK